MEKRAEYDLNAAIADLRAEQARIEAATDRMSSVTGSAVSKDRAVTATVDSQGRLVELKLAAERYRRIAPAELAASIVATVRQAQDDAFREATSMLSGLMPDGLGLPLSGDLDLAAMFDAAVTAATVTSQEGTDDNA
ncbi:YbaB/EbfC family nucleoid-associated protein [Actinoallomurus sp. CA-142502]|uniref:YbaB/EbfC family nucleoid-associated protein n=1 Tax=Actinoallomurus sp. CA-142502 TaxID=3239885 RepID=UPI003D91A694